MKIIQILVFILLLLSCGAAENSQFITYSPKSDSLFFVWKNPEGEKYLNMHSVTDSFGISNSQVKFLMNGGMFDPLFNPVGLYIENGLLLNQIDQKKDQPGNFYIQPNGIFTVDYDGSVQIIKTEDFRNNDRIKFATQSGPILVWERKINPYFNPDSENTNIRNAVGIKADGEVIFVISKDKVSFYQLSQFMVDSGCKKALYLDGFVSNMYTQENGYIHPNDFNYGIMIMELE